MYRRACLACAAGPNPKPAGCAEVALSLRGQVHCTHWRIRCRNTIIYYVVCIKCESLTFLVREVCVCLRVCVYACVCLRACTRCYRTFLVTAVVLECSAPYPHPPTPPTSSASSSFVSSSSSSFSFFSSASLLLLFLFLFLVHLFLFLIHLFLLLLLLFSRPLSSASSLLLFLYTAASALPASIGLCLSSAGPRRLC